MQMPMVAVQAEASYALGFPMLVAVTLENPTTDTNFLDLPEWTPELDLDSLSVAFRPADGQAPSRFGPSFMLRDRSIASTTVLAGERKQFLVDLSTLGFDLPPGGYEMSVTLHRTASDFIESAPVSISLNPLEASDAAQLQQMQLIGRWAVQDRADWRAFLTRVPPVRDPPPVFSAGAARQVAYHLFLNEAVAAGSIDSVPTDRLKDLQGPVLGPEAMLLNLEMVELGGDRARAAQLAAALRNAHPALGHRIDAIIEGQGPIANGRNAMIR